MNEQIDNKLNEIKLACIGYGKGNKTLWILYAIERYINTGRASTEFLKLFIGMSKAKINNLIKRCMENNTMSDDEIVSVFKKSLKYKTNN